MKLKYDFHIHSALSPCALNEMTPNNIVNMAIISELDVIGITDHNSCKNAEAIVNIAKSRGLIVLPGMEVESKEEVHVVCLFPATSDVYNMQELVYDQLPRIPNKKKVFGEQLILNQEDDIIGHEERLLSFATGLSLEQVINYTMQHNGVAFPAHIDRPSFSILSNLGTIPENISVHNLEISRFADYTDYLHKYKKYRILQSSDSHELGFIGICERHLELPDDMDINSKTIIQYLRTAP